MTEGSGNHVLLCTQISLKRLSMSHVLVLQPSNNVDGADMEKTNDKPVTHDMEEHDADKMEKSEPAVDLGLVLQLRGSEEDRQGLLSDLDNMEIAWEDFILEEPGSTRALVQANLTTR